jgi:hypothetical protein
MAKPANSFNFYNFEMWENRFMSPCFPCKLVQKQQTNTFMNCNKPNIITNH